MQKCADKSSISLQSQLFSFFQWTDLSYARRSPGFTFETDTFRLQVLHSMMLKALGFMTPPLVKYSLGCVPSATYPELWVGWCSSGIGHRFWLCSCILLSLSETSRWSSERHRLLNTLRQKLHGRAPLRWGQKHVQQSTRWPGRRKAICYQGKMHLSIYLSDRADDKSFKLHYWFDFHKLLVSSGELTHHSVGRLEQQPFDVQSGIIAHPELMVAGQRGIVSNNSLHLRLGTRRQHSQQNCEQRDQSDVCYLKGIVLIKKTKLRSYQHCMNTWKREGFNNSPGQK